MKSRLPIENNINIAIDFDETIYNSYTYKVKRDALNNLGKLIDNGFTLHIVTARFGPDNEIKQALEIFKSHGISFKSIQFSSGAPKGFYCNKIGAVALVDDNIYYMQDLVKYGIEGYIYEDNWEDIVDDIIFKFK